MADPATNGSQIEEPIEAVKHWAEYGRSFDHLQDTGMHPTVMGPARRPLHFDPVGVVGATLITGGGIPEDLPTGYFTQPTLLGDVDPNSRVAQEEIFGPVLTVTAYDTDDDAIAIANNSIYGLSGEVSSADNDRALAVAQRMRTGSVTVNGKSFFGITSPFGGTKQSGLGRRNGTQGFEEYLEIKTIGLPG